MLPNTLLNVDSSLESNEPNSYQMPIAGLETSHVHSYLHGVIFFFWFQLA